MENISQMSLLEVALSIMEEKGGAVNIYELIHEVLEKKGIADDDYTVASKLYLDITTSSKFVYMGEDNWDLKSRQSLDQFDKDGASFNPKAAKNTEEPDEDEENEESEDDEDEDEDKDDSDEDDDESSDDESEEDEESEYESEEDEESENEEDEDEDNGFDEDKYNKYMDDYEDQYEN